MRLIDADAMIEDLKNQMKTATNPFFAMSCDFCIFHLEEQPTAYDVEEKVAELKKEEEEFRERADRRTQYDDFTVRYYALAKGIDIAIEIVRGKE